MIHEVKSKYDYLMDTGLIKNIQDMLFLDYIVHNRDRHGANVEVLCSREGVRLSPIYDCGSSLLAPLQYNTERILQYDLLSNGPVNNYLVSVYWDDVICKLKEDNYNVPELELSKLVVEDIVCGILQGRDIIMQKQLEMIERRYLHAKEVLNS